MTLTKRMAILKEQWLREGIHNDKERLKEMLVMHNQCNSEDTEQLTLIRSIVTQLKRFIRTDTETLKELK